jgi:predicted ATPase/class 3 adenylate cyclase
VGLPEGTVTFLFTDIEGSTALLHEHGGGYAEILSEHRRILRAAFAEHGGTEVDTQGDAFFVAFPTAQGALKAANDAQSGLAAGSIRVRMGIHTGTPHMSEEGYVGLDVHRAARIAACGHGGQVLVSSSAAALLDSEGLHDLGEHRLKDLAAPERIYQLGTEKFPPLKSLHRTNLPIPATPFLGREHELAEVLELLAHDGVRLLTLTGPGGMGKTRLGLQAAADDAERYPDGVFWVPLAAVRDPELVLETAAHVLGAKQGLVEHIADKSLLLLFDNFEHVVDAADDLSDLLAACPNLRLLVTSREVLRIPSEQAYPVPPLEPRDGTELFVTRARAMLPGFVASQAVMELCARLEQLPLALELAAARITVLSPEQLLERLAGRLDLLRAGRGVDARQQTLRATMEWSYDLLNADEQELFAGLAVFAGGWTLEASEVVCAADLDTLHSLVDKSLVRVREGDRFWMLETLREYASERLEQSALADELRRRHAECFLALAERAANLLESDGLERSGPLVTADEDNFQEALEWAGSAGSRLGLRLASALWRFWIERGRVTEARRRLEEFLSAGPHEPDGTFGWALVGLASCFYTQGELEAARELLEEALPLLRNAAHVRHELDALLYLGHNHQESGDVERAREVWQQARKLAFASGHAERLAYIDVILAEAALAAGEDALAEQLLEGVLSGLGATGDLVMQVSARFLLAELELRRHEVRRGAWLMSQNLADLRVLASEPPVVEALAIIAALAAEGGEAVCAARLLGAAATLSEALESPVRPAQLALAGQARHAARATLGGETFDAAFALGQTYGLEQALDEALSALDRLAV